MMYDVSPLTHIRHTNPEKALEKACKDFEAIFIHQLLKSMGKTVPEGILDAGLADEIYKDMLYMNIASSVAQSGGFGLSEILSEHIRTDGTQEHATRFLPGDRISTSE
ncbi:MAG: rod-binding protein [Desulfomonilia bacterium]|nr:rod-binding protein [Desulfomonilia bacterium]